MRLLLLLCLGLFFSDICAADSINIVLLDPKSVIEESLAFRSIQKQIAVRNNEYKKKALEQQNIIQSEYRELDAQKGSVPQQEYEQLSRKLAEKASNYNKEAHTNKERLDKALSRATENIDQTLDKIMAAYVKKMGDHIIIVNKISVVYASNSLDITDIIRQELDKQLPQVKVVFDDSTR